MLARVDLELWARDACNAVKREDLIVVIDVLRSSTSIINALANGAKSVIPVSTLKEACDLHKTHPQYLLAGERAGLKPREFDLGNSPLDFNPEHVSGKNIVMTTTSGTVALARSREARWVLIGAFVNAEAVSKAADGIGERDEVGVSFVLSGEKGKFSLEDFVCAGAIIERLGRHKGRCSDKALAALLAFERARANLTENIMKAEHAKQLARLGFIHDVEFSCNLDITKTVPFYHNGKIVPL
jgi:2-phosphosulfolactate phosphatase